MSATRAPDALPDSSDDRAVRTGARTIIGVSLKMYFDPRRTLEWTHQVAELARSHPALTTGQTELVVLPSFPTLPQVIDIVAGTGVAVGAQDLFYEDRGAFTGAVSGADLRQLGCRYVEIGHIERRRYFGEDDQIINLKVAAALRNGLTPLLCIGEFDDEPLDASTDCIAQLDSAVAGLALGAGRLPLLVAYEPAWAIGMDQPASAEHVVATTTAIRSWLDERPALRGTPIIYGGSAGQGLLSELGGAASGLFLGRFAHDAEALNAILDEAMQLG